MRRTLVSIILTLGFAAAVSGCAENEHKMTTKEESKTESQPKDTSPGTMVVE